MQVSANFTIKGNLAAVGAAVGPFQPSASKDFQNARSWTDGNSAGKLSLGHAINGTLTALGATTLNLTSFTDIFGSTQSFARVNAIALLQTGATSGATSGAVQLSTPTTNTFALTAAVAVAMKPVAGGGWAGWADPGYTGIPVVAGDKIIVTNNDATNTATFELYLGGNTI